MQYYVYILKSQKNNRYYIGHTDNLPKRIKEHNSGKSRSTKFGIPWILLKKELYYSKREAAKREKQLKQIKKRKILEKIIAG